MRTNLKSLATALAMASAPIPCHADIGPKPSATFAIAFDKPGLRIEGGTLLQCQHEDCADAAPLQELGPQRFACEPTSCSAQAYGFARYAILEISLSDGRKLKSAPFPMKGFNQRYNATVAESTLEVTQAQ